MQRYSSASCGGVSNCSVGGTSARDAGRADASFLTSNISLNPRRGSQLNPYKLKCDKESLNGRLGPPDYYQRTLNCPEETLTREYVQNGYKETVEGLEEAREIQLTHVGNFIKSEFILKCKEALRKRHRAINESRAQKRKVGQVYGVPLNGSYLVKSGAFPEQRAYSDDFRRKWIEGLSQKHRRLQPLAEHIPHGYRRKALFEVLIRYNVPLLRATWFIKVNYLNQVRPSSADASSGSPEKSQSTRSDLWTKDVIEYLQQLLDEFILKDGSLAVPSRDLLGVIHQRGDLGSGIADAEEPSLLFKWSYMTHLLQWHHAEGLLHPSLIIEWVLNQLQEKGSADTLELLSPIMDVFTDIMAFSQTYVRNLVDIAVRFINDLCSGCMVSAQNSKRPSLVSALIEMLHYLILVVPDTFVSLDCFPLPVCVVPDFVLKNTFLKLHGEVDNPCLDLLNLHNRCLSVGYTASFLQNRATCLAKVVNPNLQGHGLSKVAHALDKALLDGNLNFAYTALFEDLSDAVIEEGWISEVCPRLRSCLRWIGSINRTLMSSVFFLCEWATCDYMDYRTAKPRNVKLTGRQDFCRVYVAVSLLKLRMECMSKSSGFRNDRPLISGTTEKSLIFQNIFSGTNTAESVPVRQNNSERFHDEKSEVDVFGSPGPLHDIFVCWLDQHEAGNGEGTNCVQLLVTELMRHGIFFPQAYVRQLIVSGIMDMNGTPFDWNRKARHHKILKQLPGYCLFDVLEEAKIADIPMLLEVVHAYSNERRMLLNGSSLGSTPLIKGQSIVSSSWQSQKGYLDLPFDGQRNFIAYSDVPSVEHAGSKARIDVLKATIIYSLHIPHSGSSETQPEELMWSVKRPFGILGAKVDLTNGTPGCEECRKTKMQKLGDDRIPFLNGFLPSQSDDEEAWWARKGTKYHDSFKVEPSLKSTKPALRGRRKTQSLAQLQSARIESSQGACTSHICDNKINCPHHKSISGDVPHDTDRSMNLTEITRTLKQLRSLEKRFLSIWLSKTLKQVVELNEKAASKLSHSAGGFSAPLDEKSDVPWRLGEEELSTILYILDLSSDLVSAVKLIIWLLPKILNGQSSVYVGRNMMVLGKHKESHFCTIGEAFLLASLQRYENVIVAADLLPEVLTASMNRVVAMMTSNIRSYGSTTLAFARNLLKKYRDAGSVVKWEKTFRASCDQRLLAELDTGRTMEGDSVFSPGPVAVEDHDDYIRQKMNSRLQRTGSVLRDLMQKHVEEAVHAFFGKDRKLFTSNATKNTLEKWDNGYQIAQEIVSGILDCVKQNCGATQEMDPSTVAAAVSAIMSNIGPAVLKVADFMASSNYQPLSSLSSLNRIRNILSIHILSLRILKEALGERLSRIFEISFVAEASTLISGAFSPVKASRTQFQLSSEVHDIGQNHSNDVLNSSFKTIVGRASRAVAAVSALVIGAVVHGVVNLERLLTSLKVKEGLDVLQFIRSSRSSSNGMIRPFGAFKLDHSVEAYSHWFRLLIGNCRTVFDGLVAEILGDSYISAFSRIQRMLPLNLVFHPAYSIFAMVIWRPYILNNNIATREDIQLYHNLSLAIGDAISHRPFRDIILRNTRLFYDLLSSDSGDSEFAAILELHNPDKRAKAAAFVPLRARVFLNAIIDCKMPPFTLMKEDGSLISGPNDKKSYVDFETKLLDQVVHVLDTLQPAKFHWQWVNLRLLLNEQVLIERIETQNMSLVEAIRSLSPNSENAALSENEKTFTEIVLTRVLVRPDAVPLYSEVVNILGRSSEEALFMTAKWFLRGNDILLGRKSIRQKLSSIAQSRGCPTKCQFWKPWGWSTSNNDISVNKADKKKLDTPCIEEGEVVDDGTESRQSCKLSFQVSDPESFPSVQQYITESALAELIFPLIDKSTNESCINFAGELIQQLSNIEQLLTTLTRSGSKQTGSVLSGAEGSSSKGNNRKGIKGGSPGLGKRSTVVMDSSPPSSVDLKASLWLRLQFLLRLFPLIYADRSMRRALAIVIFRLLGTRLVYEDANTTLRTIQSISKKDEDSPIDASVPASWASSGDSLFDLFLPVLHGLLSNCKPSWLKAKLTSKSTVKSPRDFSVFDREVSESLQADLDRMEMPMAVRRRIQAAMPILPSSSPLYISCNPPTLSLKLLSSFQWSTPNQSSYQGSLNPNPRSLISSSRSPTSMSGKSKVFPSQDTDLEVDPWTLLEDGSGSISCSSSSNIGGGNSDHTNIKACSWLRGAVRIRRGDLTYIGAVDDDS